MTNTNTTADTAAAREAILAMIKPGCFYPAAQIHNRLSNVANVHPALMELIREDVLRVAQVGYPQIWLADKG
jgi:hypothetical protein